MSALLAGATAPEMALRSADGKVFSLAEAKKKGPVVAIFFKVSCPTCQFAFPYFERIYKAYPNDKYTFVGVSQDDKHATEAFAREFGATFPMVLDDPAKYQASNAYGLTNVPTAFVVSREGKVEFSSVGWDKNDFERLNESVAGFSGKTPAAMFKPGEDVPDFKSG